MAIAVVDSGTATVAGGTGSGSVAFNITPAENDVVVLAVARDDAPPTWTGYTTAGSSAGAVAIEVFYKRMSSSPDSGAAFTSNTADLAIDFWILRGVDTTTAEDAVAVTNSGVATAPDTSSITTVTNNAWVISAAGQAFATNATGAPSGYSEFKAVDQGVPNVMGAWKAVAVAGAENPGAFTADAVNFTGITWAVRPALGGTAAITGTAASGTTEAHIVSGGRTIIITLTGDTWVASGSTFDAQRQNIINGIDSGQAEAAGWDAVVKAGLAVTDVVRTSNTVVTVTLPAFASYNITATETITVTVPSTAVVLAAAIVASPTFTVAVVPFATLSGTATSLIKEASIVAGGKTVILTLNGDTWVSSGANFDAQRQNIINGLDSAQAEAAGWDAVVKPGLAVTDVVRTSNTVATITLSAQASYNITATEFITATIPATALTANSAIVASPNFSVQSDSAAGWFGPRRKRRLYHP